jgi:hypothetical protein
MAIAEKKTVLEDQNFNSDRLSTQVRLVALGLLAIVWAAVRAAEGILILGVGIHVGTPHPKTEQSAGGPCAGRSGSLLVALD